MTNSFANQAVTLVSQQEVICDGYNPKTRVKMAGASAPTWPNFYQSIFLFKR